MSVKSKSDRVVGCMATFPARFSIIEEVVGRIAPQLDALFIYVNETLKGFPDLSKFSNVTVLDGQKYAGNLSANGKIYPLRFLKECKVFTLDDDIIYPFDYVAKNLEVLDQFSGRCMVTSHGRILPARVDWYYELTSRMPFANGLSSMQLCNLAGSGTLCFDQRHLSIDPDEFLDLIWVDLKLSLLARENDMPIWVLPRNEGWLQSMGVSGLWEQFYKTSLAHHTEIVRGYDFSFPLYSAIANKALNDAGKTAEQVGLDVELAIGLRTGRIPRPWLQESLSIRKRNDYVHLLLKEMESA